MNDPEKIPNGDSPPPTPGGRDEKVEQDTLVTTPPEDSLRRELDANFAGYKSKKWLVLAIRRLRGVLQRLHAESKKIPFSEMRRTIFRVALAELIRRLWGDDDEDDGGERAADPPSDAKE